MDVQLYVYDLTNGLARQASAAFLGTHIDAVYHTSIVMEGVEYVYDGGISTVHPGRTHLGQPMEIIPLGETQLPMDIVMEYLESLKQVFTVEAYDLWTHNCNNFSNDLATFLLGTGIPEYITNLPQAVLDSPFGRMMKPQVDRMVQAKKQAQGGLLGINLQNGVKAPETPQQKAQTVKKPSTIHELDDHLEAAKQACAVIFFTSETCPPCKRVYPLYAELAAEAGTRATFLKVDVSKLVGIGMKYDVRATPTFVTFLNGKEENRWTGGDPAKLRGNVQMLLQMAWPPHPHDSLHLPTFVGSDTKPVTYIKIPPLEKLKTKMGASAEDSSIQSVMQFVSFREKQGAAEARLPDVKAFSQFLQSALSELPPEIIFTIVDLLRVAMVDPRFSGYYAEEADHVTMGSLFRYVSSLNKCPYSLRLVTLQTACNLFTSPLYPEHILGCPTLATPIVQLITTSLLDDEHHNVRVAAASLSFNIAITNNQIRRKKHRELLAEEHQIELAASLLEAISVEQQSPEALKGLLLALGFLFYCTPKDGEIRDLLETMDAQSTVLAKSKLFPEEKLLKEIGEELLGRGLI